MGPENSEESSRYICAILVTNRILLIKGGKLSDAVKLTGETMGRPEALIST